MRLRPKPCSTPPGHAPSPLNPRPSLPPRSRGRQAAPHLLRRLRVQHDGGAGGPNVGAEPAGHTHGDCQVPQRRPPGHRGCMPPRGRKRLHPRRCDSSRGCRAAGGGPARRATARHVRRDAGAVRRVLRSHGFQGAAWGAGMPALRSRIAMVHAAGARAGACPAASGCEPSAAPCCPPLQCARSHSYPACRAASAAMAAALLAMAAALETWCASPGSFRTSNIGGPRRARCRAAAWPGSRTTVPCSRP